MNSKTGRRTEAYRAYEELIYSGYQHIQMVLNDLRILYMEDKNHEMAKKLVKSRPMLRLHLKWANIMKFVLVWMLRHGKRMLCGRHSLCRKYWIA